MRKKYSKAEKGTEMLKLISKLVLIAGFVFSVASCAPMGGSYNPYTTYWEEEVKLNDGRVIVVQQEKKKGPGFSAEAWVTFNLPEFSAWPIVWHETLSPMILNIDSGNLYIVGTTLTGYDAKLYGCPKPFYVAYIWIKSGGWQRIPTEQIPQSIYDANMVLVDYPDKNIHKITLDLKNSKKFNGDFAMPLNYKHINLDAPGSCH